jgi:cbb3-type cytochrome oxidase subunit 3
MHKDVIRDTALVADLELIPVITFVVFFAFFIGLIYYVIKQDKQSMHQMAAMPLADDHEQPTFPRVSSTGKAK